ncbi:MAG: LiaI-LiaF-like domain-containing protein [Candidatus Limnocylindria bacterium]
MRRNSGLLFWGVALITAGALALAVQAGVLSRDALSDAWRYWPVLLIVIGVAIIAARSPLGLPVTLVAGVAVGAVGGALLAGAPIGLGCGGEPTERTTADGAFESGAAEMDIEFSCGDLAMSMEEGDAWSLDARHGGGSDPAVAGSGSSLSLVTEGDGFFGVSGRSEWQLTLPADVMLDLSVDANAASSRLDLGGGQFGTLSLGANAGDMTLDLAGAEADELTAELNAGSMTVILDGETSATGSLGVNAGSITLCAPDDVALAITIEGDNVTFSHDLDESGLDRSSNTWRSGSGAAAVELSVEGNAASFSFNDPEACG